MSCAARLALLSALLAAVPAAAGPMPWPRTETREPCADAAPLRRPFFGDLHVHTRYSADAYIYGTRGGPRDAYDFARGGTITASDAAEQQTRMVHIERPIDFMAVTDHAEFYGEASLCETEGSLVYDDPLCQLLRQVELDPRSQERGIATVSWLYPAGISNPPTEHPFCEDPGVDCDAEAVSVWKDIQDAAEQNYDRTSACTFTSFIGYEYTFSPIGRHLHRNVIFRNEHVPSIAYSYLDTFQGGAPQGLWSAIENECLGAGTGCEAVIIPHNPNLSGGRQFLDPADAAEALRRQRLEPLVEIHQVKGNSECRFDRLAGAGSGTADELCTFEQDPSPHQGPGSEQPPIDEYPQRNMVRNVLKDGLALEQSLGANPFRLGFIGSTDTHDATPGDTGESTWNGASGNEDSTPAGRLQYDFRANPGGLAVVWAEENSRDALFEGLRRRETYATSGTRPVVRFFAGDLAGVRCGREDFVERAYATGTPMGGELGPLPRKHGPRFAVWAVKDAGTAERAGADLQRVQIVKGWVDAEGTTHEQVYDVAGDADNGAGVDPATCEPTGSGAADLCAVWEDPEWSRDERAFYYVRVLEDPSCRWSTLLCHDAGVDPFAGDCAAQAAAAGPAFADCCLGESNDSFVSPVVQERAWTSPIWIRPEGIARLAGRVRFGRTPGRDVLDLRVQLGAAVDPGAEDVLLRVADDDDIVALTVPAGRLEAQGRGRWRARKGDVDGVKRLTVVARGKSGTKIHLTTAPGDLSQADRLAHMVKVVVGKGTEQHEASRRWELRGRTLATAKGGR